MKLLDPYQAPLYGTNPWQITENAFSPASNLLSETIFALGNGYIGIRGSLEEGLTGNGSRTIEGIYLNGFYESVPIPHAEKGYGYALNTQTMLNVTDSKIIELYLDRERFSLDSGTILSFKRVLDLKQGHLLREVVWRSPRGREIKLTVRRLVSFKHRHLLAFKYEVLPLNFSGPITIISSLNGSVDNHTHEENDPRFSATLGGLGLSVMAVTRDDQQAVMLQETQRSGLKLACAMDNRLTSVCSYAIHTGQNEDTVSVSYLLEAEENKPAVLEKYVAYYTTRDYPGNNLHSLAEEMVLKAKNEGFQSLLDAQKEHLDRYWDTVGLEFKGDPLLEQGLRFNIFHLLQSVGNDGKTGVSSKGLTSEGYDGHYFWDMEIYMIPFYAALLPDRARKLLQYRYSILDHARSRARELAHPRGALYPWRTIAGEEGSSYYPAGTAQYHINAAVAYAISKYLEMTGDLSFILDYGAEIIFETARLWEDLGTYIPRKDNQFCFNEVTGPDEYTALVNNNCYNNLMARWHLQYAHDLACLLKQDHPRDFARLAGTIGLEEQEIESWREAAERMFIPYDSNLQILPQDDGFLDKEIWDFASTPPDNYPLLLYYHPLVIYRYQVCKQPDVILAHLLLADNFDREQKRRDYNYYEAITTHDSSLSPSIFSTVASELRYKEDAWHFFSIATKADLGNLFRDTHFGVHTANMAGSWLCLTYGFAGMRTQQGKLSFDPYLPGHLDGYRFRLLFKKNWLEVEVLPGEASYTLLSGADVTFYHGEQQVTLTTGEKRFFSLEEESPTLVK